MESERFRLCEANVFTALYDSSIHYGGTVLHKNSVNGFPKHMKLRTSIKQKPNLEYLGCNGKMFAFHSSHTGVESLVGDQLS